MKGVGILALAVVVLTVLTVAMGGERGGARVHLYAGAGLRPLVEPLAAAFAAESGIPVDADYGGSGVILSRAQLDARPACILPGESWYIDRLEDRGRVVAERVPVAELHPVLMVAAGNPRGIESVADLGQPELTIGLGRADANQIGRLSDAILARVGLSRQDLMVRESLTVNELGMWVAMGNVDVAIVWALTARGHAEACMAVPIADHLRPASEVVCARLAGDGPGVEAGRRFCAFLAGETARSIIARAGL